MGAIKVAGVRLWDLLGSFGLGNYYRGSTMVSCIQKVFSAEIIVRDNHGNCKEKKNLCKDHCLAFEFWLSMRYIEASQNTDFTCFL